MVEEGNTNQVVHKIKKLFEGKKNSVKGRAVRQQAAVATSALRYALIHLRWTKGASIATASGVVRKVMPRWILFSLQGRRENNIHILCRCRRKFPRNPETIQNCRLPCNGM